MKKALIIFAGAIAPLVAFYFLFGIVAVQPIGAVPDGATIVYFRPGTGLPFITSPDGLILDQGEDLSLLGRLRGAAEIAERTKDRKVVTLPYIRAFYLWSTGGNEFER